MLRTFLFRGELPPNLLAVARVLCAEEASFIVLLSFVASVDAQRMCSLLVWRGYLVEDLLGGGCTELWTRSLVEPLGRRFHQLWIHSDETCADACFSLQSLRPQGDELSAALASSGGRDAVEGRGGDPGIERIPFNWSQVDWDAEVDIQLHACVFLSTHMQLHDWCSHPPSTYVQLHACVLLAGSAEDPGCV